uniref:Phage protein D n=2 Tax=Vibrio TaxID=662 RepID=A0A0H3ZXP3_9VIBR|nr:Phage protein D [Vibrio tasmaniensis]
MKPHGYKIRIDKDLANVKTEHLNQTEETDKHFISRLAKRYDAIAKPINGFYVFGKKGNIKTLSGGKKKAVTLTKASMLYGQNDVSYPSVTRFKGVKASWRESDTGAHGDIEIGSKPFDRLREPFKSAAQATERAEARLIEVTRQGQVLNATVDGTAGLFAEAVLTIEGFNNNRIVAPWSIDEVSLSGNRKKFTARIKATRPK